MLDIPAIEFAVHGRYFSTLSRNKNLLHYEVSFEIIKKEPLDKDDRLVLSTGKYDFHHWFYDPELDIFTIFSTDRKLTRVDAMHNKNVLDVNEQEPSYIITHRGKNTISLGDPSRRYEELLINCFKARLECLGYDGGIRLLKPKKGTNGKFRLKFLDDADFASFRIAFDEFIWA